MTTKYTYDERNAIALVRKTMLTKPEIIKEIMKDLPYLSSFNILQQAQRDLNQLLGVTQAFSEAAMAIMKQQKEHFNAND